MQKFKKHPIKSIFRLVFYFIFIFIMSSIVFRSCRMSDIPLNDKVLMNEKFLEAYHSDPDNFSVKQYGMKDAYIQAGEGRLLVFDKMYYVPLANQVQITLKYNTDIIFDTYGDIPLRVYISDKEGNVYDNYFYEYEENYQYAFLRMCFEDIIIAPDRKYTIHVFKKLSDGSEETVAEYCIYNGSEIYQEIEFSVV